MVVFADKKDRQFPDAGHIEPLMEGAIVNGSIPEKRHSHIVPAQQLETVATPAGLKNAGPDDTAGAHHPNLRLEQVHAAAAALGTSGLSAKQLCDQFLRLHTLG